MSKKLNIAIRKGSTTRSEQDYTNDLFGIEIMEGLGFHTHCREIPTKTSRRKGICKWADAVEPTPEQCLRVHFDGVGLLNGSEASTIFNMFSDQMVKNIDDSVTPVVIHYTNIDTPRTIYIATSDVLGLKQKLILVQSQGGPLCVNTSKTIMSIGLQHFPNHTLCPRTNTLLTKESVASVAALTGFAKANSKFSGSSTFGYHGKERIDKTKRTTKFRVGVEIEKIAEENSKVCAHKLYDKCGIIKENDSSLGSGGNEYVTGIIDFDELNTIKKELKPIKHLIDLPFKEGTILRAGGHINVSEKGLSGHALAKKLKQYMPLLYALYPERALMQSYSRVAKFDCMVDSPSKRAIYPKRALLEIRVFPAVETYNNLMDRLELVHYMLNNDISRYSTVVTELGTEGTVLNKIIEKLDADIPKILSRFVIFSKIDEGKMTPAAKAVLTAHSIGEEEEVKMTFDEWEDGMKDADSKVPSNLRKTYCELKLKKVI